MEKQEKVYTLEEITKAIDWELRAIRKLIAIVAKQNFNLEKLMGKICITDGVGNVVSAGSYIEDFEKKFEAEV